MKRIIVAVVLGMGISSASAQTAWEILPKHFSAINKIRFFDRDTGFVLSGTYNFQQFSIPPDSLWKTTNGGVSWSLVVLPIDSPFQLYDLCVFKNQIWIACVGHKNDHNVRLLHSNDIGSSWQIAKFDSNRYPFEVSFSTDSIGYILYRSDTSSVSPKSADSLCYTLDGGESWRIGPQASYGYDLCHGYASTVQWVQPTPHYQQVFRSTDYGVSSSGGRLSNSTGFLQFAYAGNRVWLYEGDGGYRSTDDGATWNANNTFESERVWCDTLGDAYVFFHSDSVEVSRDRGLTWRAYYSGIAGGNLVEIIDSLYAYAAWTDLIYKTKSGGIGSFSSVKVGRDNSNEVTIFPNPASEEIHLSTLAASISILDVLGREQHFSVRRDTDGAVCDVRSLPNGIYFVMIEGNHPSIIHFVVQH